MCCGTRPLKVPVRLPITVHAFDTEICCRSRYICFPFVLLYHSLRIYVLPCCISYALGACGQFWLLVGEKLLCLCNCACSRKASVCCCYEYDDAEFPPTAASVGQWKNKSAEEVDKEIEWKRGNQICSVTEVTGGETDAVQHVRLFSGKIEPSDIGQGQLGDCWLMTALACLSEFPGAIQNIFETVEYNPRGRYVVKLYCGQKRRWEPIVVDDWIPVKRGTDIPIFAKPNGKVCAFVHQSGNGCRSENCSDHCSSHPRIPVGAMGGAS